MTKHDDTNNQFSASRRTVLKGLGGLGAAAAVTAAGGFPGIIRRSFASDPIRVGVISPLSGAWTVYGRAHIAGLEMAVKEVNDAGGVLGRPLELVVADSRTEPSVVVEEANRLVRRERVDFLAGTFSSAERNAAGPVVDGTDTVLLYPTFYEGQKQEYHPGVCNPNIFAFGPIPSQQVEPHMDYMTENHGNRFFMIGNDYAWPRVTNEVTKPMLERRGGEVVGEVYIPFDTPQYESVLRDIRNSGADVIFHTLTGSDTVNFRNQLAQAGMMDDFTLWTVDDEEVVTSSLGPESAAGDFVSFDYFMAINTPNNGPFLRRFRAEYGNDALMNTVGVAMYNAGHMAALALERSGEVSTEALRSGLKGLTFDGAPQGSISMREEDNQAVLPSYLVQVNESWNTPEEIFTVIQSFDSVTPSTAECDSLPLQA